MEVAARTKGMLGPTLTSSKVQETQDGLSKFWVNLKFTFQTNSKLYYILEYIGETTLESVYESNGPLTEDVVIFYASEMVIALEELHSCGLLYGELDMEKVFLDKTGHVVLWRNFCGKKYWTRRECVCNMAGFTRGSPCENPHSKSSEREIKFDFQLLGLVMLQLFSREKLTSVSNNKTSKQER
jgi:serine/threonine protein kinase